MIILIFLLPNRSNCVLLGKKCVRMPSDGSFTEGEMMVGARPYRYNGEPIVSAKNVAFATAIHVSDRLLSRILEFAGALIVARVLAPEAFGVVMIGVSALSMARGLTEFPVANALIQKRQVDQSDYATVFALTNARGVLIALSLVAVAGILADIYDEPSVVPIIYFLAIAPLADGFKSPMMAKYLREMNFVPLAIASLSGRVVGFITTVTVILTTGSMWALVLGIIVTPLITLILTYILAPSKIDFSLAHGKEYFAFSSWMSLAGGILIAYADGAKFIVGIFVSTAALGIYSVGYSLARTAIFALAGPTIQTFFVGFSTINDDPGRLRSSYLRAQSVLVTLFMPVGIGLVVISEPLIALLLGTEWADAAFVIAWLAPGMAYFVSSAPAQAMAMAVNKTKSMFFRNLAVVIISLPLLLYGAAYHGLQGVVIARLIGSLINTFAGFLLVHQLIGLPFLKQVVAGWRSMIAAALMLIFHNAFISGHINPEGQTWFMQSVFLISVIAVNAVFYLAILVGLWFSTGRQAGPETTIFNLVMRRIRSH